MMDDYRPHMLAKIRSDQLLQAIRGMPCTIRIAGFVRQPCSGLDTVVPCHLPVWGKGAATKVTDMAVVAGCMACHNLLDGRDNRLFKLPPEIMWEVVSRYLEALTETHALLIERGIITVKGMEVVEA